MQQNPGCLHHQSTSPWVHPQRTSTSWMIKLPDRAFCLNPCLPKLNHLLAYVGLIRPPKHWALIIRPESPSVLQRNGINFQRRQLTRRFASFLFVSRIITILQLLNPLLQQSRPWLTLQGAAEYVTMRGALTSHRRARPLPSHHLPWACRTAKNCRRHGSC